MGRQNNIKHAKLVELKKVIKRCQMNSGGAAYFCKGEGLTLYIKFFQGVKMSLFSYIIGILPFYV